MALGVKSKIGFVDGTCSNPASGSDDYDRWIKADYMADYMELPTSFVKEHGESLSKYAHLKVPTGAESKMELKRRDGRAWLHKGWQDFVDKYSIQGGYFLVFKYEGGSRFNVLIFDLSTSEIKYPVSSARTCNKKAGKLTEVKEEEEDDESLDELPQKVGKSKKLQMAKESRKLISGHQSFSGKNKSLGGDLVNVGVTSARDRVTERAKAFQSPNFQFSITLQQTYISRSYLIIPVSPARSYFSVKGSNDISLKVADGRTWCMKYTVGAPPLYRVWISSGWANFKQDNHLQKGDTCVFELVNNSTSVIFKVTIHPIAAAADLESNKNGPLVVTDVTSNAMEKFKKSVESFECKNPHFEIRMTSYYVSQRPKVHIPSPHAKRYLKKDRHGKNVIMLHGSNGKTWPVHYHHYIKSSIVEKVEFIKGWKDFASENRLRVGDRLVFEMINGKPKEYKVNIFRVADHVLALLN